MKTLITKWLTNEEGPKVFFSDSNRMRMYEFAVDQYDWLKENLKDDFEFEGIYILLGSDDEKGNVAYIGETDSINKRLKQHFIDSNKDFVERIIVISSKDILYPYTKTDIHYFEKELIAKFKSSNYSVENSNNGQGKEPNPLTKMSLDEELKLIFAGLNALDIDLEKSIELLSKNESIITSSRTTDISIYMNNGRNKINGILHPDNAVTILANQVVYLESLRSCDWPTAKKIFSNEIKVPGMEVKNYPSGNVEIIFSQNVRFNKPSTAACIVNGGNTSGWKQWKETATNEIIDKFRKHY